MFRKLVSNVSFSPALVGQLSFYARRLKKEEATRRLGLIFTALALVIQSFTVFSPPEPANAASSNDMVYGGISSRAEFVTAYNRDARLRNVMNMASISLADINATETRHINNLSNGTGKNAWRSYGWHARFSHQQGEVRHNANGTIVYSRPHHLYNITDYQKRNGQNIKVLYGKSSKTGKAFGIMYDCGNLWTPGVPVPPPPPPPPPPAPKYACSSLSRIKQTDPTKYIFRAKASAENGASITAFSFDFGNGKKQRVNAQRSEGKYVFADVPHTYTAPGTYNVKLTAHARANGKEVSVTSENCQKPVTIPQQNPNIQVEKKVKTNGKWLDEAEVERNKPFEYRVVVKNTGDTVINNAVVKDTADEGIELTKASAGKLTSSREWTHTISRLAPGASQSFTLTAKTARYTTASVKYLDNRVCVDAPSIPGQPDDCDNAAVELPEQPIRVCDLTTNTIITIKPSDFDESRHSRNLKDCTKIQVCDMTTNTIITIREPAFDDKIHTRDLTKCEDIQVCDLETGEIVVIKRHQFDESKHSKDAADCVPAVAQSKTAVNLTQDGADATEVLAQTNDRIQYTVTAHNTGAIPAKVSFVEQLDDVMEYASLVDNGGGRYDKDRQSLSWPEVTLQAGESQSRMLTVQVVSKIPAGAQGVSDRSSYDCIMINTYGNATEINVNCPTTKVVEQVVTELPTTGPTENIIFGGLLITLVTYFYARSRQVKQEVRLVRRNINAGTI